MQNYKQQCYVKKKKKILGRWLLEGSPVTFPKVHAESSWLPPRHRSPDAMEGLLFHLQYLSWCGDLIVQCHDIVLVWWCSVWLVLTCRLSCSRALAALYTQGAYSGYSRVLVPILWILHKNFLWVILYVYILFLLITALESEEGFENDSQVARHMAQNSGTLLV